MRISESAPSVAPDYKSVAVEPGTVSDDTRACQNVTPRAEQVSFCRIWEDFPDAAFGLAKQNREKTGVFCTKQPLCAMFYGRFLLFGAVRPRNLAAETRKSGPRKRNSRPRNFFSRPRFFQTAARKPFFPLFGTFSPANPRCQYVGTSPARLTCPGNPCAETAAPATKRKPAPSIYRHLGFRTLREIAFFAPATAPCPVQANLSGLQMTKCQIPRQIAKCQIRRSVSAGKHETVPRYISTAPRLYRAKQKLRKPEPFAFWGI